MPFCSATVLPHAAGSVGFSNVFTVTTYRLYLWSLRSFWMESSTSPLRLPSTLASSTMFWPEGMVTGSSAQAAAAGAASIAVRPITARIRFNIDRMATLQHAATGSGRTAVTECSSAPTPGVKPQVAVAILLDSMVHQRQRPRRGICHQRKALETLVAVQDTGQERHPGGHSGTSQQTSVLVSVGSSIVNTDEDERKSND